MLVFRVTGSAECFSKHLKMELSDYGIDILRGAEISDAPLRATYPFRVFS